MTMTNNPTIDGVSRTDLQAAYEELTDWKSPVAQKLRALLDAPVVERQPVEVPVVGKLVPNGGGYDCWHPAANQGQAVVLQSDLDEYVAALQFTIAQLRQHKNDYMEAAEETRSALMGEIAQLQARVAELESGRGEPVAYVCPEFLSSGKHATHARRDPTDTHSFALYGEVASVEKYDEVLLPFLALMRAELHANAHKGDRPGWLQMDRKTAILEVFYHMGKLHQAVHRGEEAAIKEYASDVANMCMMLLDVCACLDATAALNGPAK